MTSIPDGYPSELSDLDLDAELKRMIAIASQMNVRFENLLPELKIAIIRAGLQERLGRETEVLRMGSATASWRALLISLVALLVSLATLMIAVFK